MKALFKSAIGLHLPRLTAADHSPNRIASAPSSPKRRRHSSEASHLSRSMGNLREAYDTPRPHKRQQLSCPPAILVTDSTAQPPPRQPNVDDDDDDVVLLVEPPFSRTTSPSWPPPSVSLASPASPPPAHTWIDSDGLADLAHNAMQLRQFCLGLVQRIAQHYLRSTHAAVYAFLQSREFCDFVGEFLDEGELAIFREDSDRDRVGPGFRRVTLTRIALTRVVERIELVVHPYYTDSWVESLRFLYPVLPTKRPSATAVMADEKATERVAEKATERVAERADDGSPFALDAEGDASGPSVPYVPLPNPLSTTAQEELRPVCRFLAYMPVLLERVGQPLGYEPPAELLVTLQSVLADVQALVAPESTVPPSLMVPVDSLLEKTDGARPEDSQVGQGVSESVSQKLLPGQFPETPALPVEESAVGPSEGRPSDSLSPERQSSRSSSSLTYRSWSLLHSMLRKTVPVDHKVRKIRPPIPPPSATSSSRGPAHRRGSSIPSPAPFSSVSSSSSSPLFPSSSTSRIPPRKVYARPRPLPSRIPRWTLPATSPLHEVKKFEGKVPRPRRKGVPTHGPRKHDMGSSDLSAALEKALPTALVFCSSPTNGDVIVEPETTKEVKEDLKEDSKEGTKEGTKKDEPDQDNQTNRPPDQTVESPVERSDTAAAAAETPEESERDDDDDDDMGLMRMFDEVDAAADILTRMTLDLHDNRGEDGGILRHHREKVAEQDQRLRDEAEQKRQAKVEAERRKREMAEEAERKKREAAGGLRHPQRTIFPALSDDWYDKIDSVMGQGSRSAGRLLPCATQEGELTTRDFSRLVPETVWLNDEVVNGSLLWVDEWANKTAGATGYPKSSNRRCLVMNSFFYKVLQDKGGAGTERALKRKGVTRDNFMALALVLVPICEGNHWTLLVIRPTRKLISHVDSMNPTGSTRVTSLGRRWLQTLLQLSADEDRAWRVAAIPTPLQTNGHDCGVHTILNGLCLAVGVDPTAAYASHDLPDLRLAIAAMLLNQGFRGEFDLVGV